MASPLRDAHIYSRAAHLQLFGSLGNGSFCRISQTVASIARLCSKAQLTQQPALLGVNSV